MPEPKAKHFILKHKKCGGVFTINLEKFLDYLNGRNEPKDKKGGCPSCGDETLNIKALATLLEVYHTQQEFLAKDGYSIREIKEAIEPEKLKL